MKRIVGFLTVCIMGAVAGVASAQVAGTKTIGVTTIETEALVMGWSAKKDLMGKELENEKKEKVGKIEDLIISQDRSVAAVIVGVGGFVGMSEHNVAIPINQLKLKEGHFILEGATKDSLKAIPEFKYSKEKKSGSM